MASASRTASSARGCPRLRAMTSPPPASLSRSAASRAALLSGPTIYSSRLMNIFSLSRRTRMPVGSSTCLISTIIFIDLCSLLRRYPQAVGPEEVAGQDDPLDLVGAFKDLGD